MTVTPGRLRPDLQVLGGVVALVLVAFAAIRLIGNAPDARTHAVPGTTVGSAAAATTQSAEKARQVSGNAGELATVPGGSERPQLAFALAGRPRLKRRHVRNLDL